MNWQTPQELPDLRRVDTIAIDTETNDAGLRAGRGSSWAWGDGHIAGVSFAWHEGNAINKRYFPITHPASVNFPREQVFRWFKDHIAARVTFITMNGLYDWGWLRADGGVLMPPANQIEEVGAAAAMVNENLLRYSLDALCTEYGLLGKDTALLEQACQAAGFKIGKNTPPQSYIWQLPADVCGPYAEHDAEATLGLHEKFIPIIEREGTREAYRLECDLLPMVHEMRHRGIRIDQDVAKQTYDLLIGKRDAALQEISDQHGSAVSMVEIRGKKWLEQTFDRYGISYPRTAKGNPSFSSKKSGWMAEHKHWLPRGIAVANRYNHAGETFIRGHILDHVVNGRIHGEIRPHLADEGGTISFRFSYSKPPLQQMPKRDTEIGPLIRDCFLPEEDEFWVTADASQQEFRGWVHYGVLEGLPSAIAAAKAYHDDPFTDFHDLVARMTELDRDTAKTANFAKGYGSGVATFAKTIGKSVQEAAAIMAQYDARLSFVAKLFHIEQEKAQRTGITRLYDGALRHWNRYAPPWQDKNACSFEKARDRVTDPSHPWCGQELRRADTRKAFNALVQGLGARMTKRWMLAVYREGIIPLLMMHDALEISTASREVVETVTRLGEEAVSLKVPMIIDVKFGKSWGEASRKVSPSWEELTGEPAQVKSALRPAIKPASTISIQPKSEIIIPPKPTIVIPPKPTIPLQPRAHAEKQQLPSSSPPPPPPPDEAETEIDLADLIDRPVPRNRKICCPLHGETKPSMHIYTDHYYCYGCGAWGDHVDWLVQVEGLEYDQALDIVDNWDGPVIPRLRAQDAEADARRTASALKWWDAAKPLAGTLAAQYLAETRGIDLNALPANIDDALRFHPHCPFGPGTVHPCLLALMRDAVGNAPTGIQRIALTADARKIDRMMYGPGGVVKLWPAGKQLAVGEGLETTLAAATRLDYGGAPLRPAWAALSDGGMSRFPVIAGVERLIVLADNDANGAGQQAADACIQRWRQAGRSGARLLPKDPDTDFNDVVREMLAGAS